MCAYKRRSAWSKQYSGLYPTTTKVSLHWSQKSGAYSLQFHDTKHWNEMQIFISYIKTQPTNERDYDPETKVWFFTEKHLAPIQEMFKCINTGTSKIFDVDFIEKPIGQTSQAVFVPVEEWQNKYKQLTGLQDLDRKSYLRWMMKNHPDRCPENAKLVSDVNECWNEINKKEMEYVTT